MEFVMKDYKKNEFESAIKSFTEENKISLGMVTFNFDDSGKVTAIVQDSVISKLTEVQLLELKAIK